MKQKKKTSGTESYRSLSNNSLRRSQNLCVGTPLPQLLGSAPQNMFVLAQDSINIFNFDGKIGGGDEFQKIEYDIYVANFHYNEN